MGGEGSMMAANQSLKNNRALVVKRKENRALSGSYANLEIKEFPEATAEDLELIKQKIKRQKRKSIIRQILIFTMLLIGVVILYKLIN